VVFLQKVEHVSGFLAAETMEPLIICKHGKRSGLFVMERAATDVP